MRSNFSPFEKEITDLRATDLSSLKQAHEGWYIEYKSEMVNASAIAKAVSAFANTYGGWLFIGIAEVSKGDNVAGEFLGVPIVQKDKIRQQVRSAVAANLQPTPYYEIRFVDGPDETIGLAGEKSIIVIHVPLSLQAPHVHKDGRIYKRVSDSSEPKPENDPHLLSQLFSRRDKSHEVIGRWIGENPEFSERESKGPYLRILLTPDDWGQSQAFLNAPASEVRSILKGSPEEGYYMPLETTHLTNTGYVGRQTAGNDRSNYGITFQIDRKLNCEFVLPLRWHKLRLEELWVYLDEYLFVHAFLEGFDKKRENFIKVMDLNFLYAALVAMVMKYRKLMQLAGNDIPYFAKVILLNGWRFVPFLDDGDYITQIAKHGIPMIMQDEVISPPGRKAGSFSKVTTSQFAEDYTEETKAGSQAFLIVKEIFELMGIDVLLEDCENEDRSFISISNLVEANNRAKKNQDLINELNSDER